MPESFWKSGINKALFLSSLLFLLIQFVLVTQYAPLVPQQAWAQRIFYYHVPVAWLAFLFSLICAIYSVLYLLKRQTVFDVYASSAAKFAIFFVALVLITGPIWARPIWGKMWTWEPRLTTTLILFIIYAGYFMVRSYGGNFENASRFAAVIGVLAFVDVPIIYFAVDFWDTGMQVHPKRDMAGHNPAILQTFLFSLFTMTFFAVQLFRYQAHVSKLELRLLEEE